MFLRKSSKHKVIFLIFIGPVGGGGIQHSGYQYFSQANQQQQQQQQASLQNHSSLILHPHLMPTTNTATTTTIPGGGAIVYQPSSISTPNSPSLKIAPRRGMSCSANATPQLLRKTDSLNCDVIDDENVSSGFPGNGTLYQNGGNFENIQKPEESIQNGSKSLANTTADKSEFAKVSEDMNELVYHLNSIQHDISELAGRPISICDSKE